MSIRKSWNRYTFDSLTQGVESPSGRLFISEMGQYDYSGVHILHTGLDTVKQLYSGNINPESFDKVKDIYDSEYGGLVTVGGLDFVVGAGSRGGYRLSLQNADMGVYVLYGTKYAELEDEASHLKIELSPHYIHSRTISEIQLELDALARHLLISPTPCGIAAHICADVQGWTPPDDFEQNLTTRAKRQFKINGIDSLSFDLGGIAAIHGARESFTFGNASALQFSIYDKVKEAKYRDKLPQWEEKWKKQTDDNFTPLYDDSSAVWRFEFRFHHNVVKEFAAGISQRLNSLKDIEPHLTGLWRYACNSYRLDYSRTYIDPFWQLLRDDVVMYGPSPDVMYKRVRKGPGVGNERNVAAAIGNLITIYAKNGFTAKQAYTYLENAGFFDDFLAWQIKKEFSKSMMLQYLEKEICKRRLLGIAA